MILYWTLFGIDALIWAIVLYFFFEGIDDWTVSAYNIGLWSLMIFIPMSILIGGWYLNSVGHQTMAKLVLSLLAVPCFLYFLFFLLTLIGMGNRH
jgi:hypothetical protein